MLSLRARVALGVGLLVVAALVAFASRFYQVTLEWTQQNALELAKDKTIRLGRWVPTDRPEFEEAARSAFEDAVQGFHGAVLPASGVFDRRQASRYFPEGDFSVPSTCLTNAEPWREPHASIREAANGERYAAAWYPIGHGPRLSQPPAGWTVAAVPLADLQRRTTALRGNMIVRILSIAVSITVLAYLLVGLWTRSLTVAAESAEQLSQGELGMRDLAVPRGEGELRRLVLAFNALLERLRQLHAVQQRFVADAAHELRTPLTILRGEIQVALRKERDLGRYQAVLHSNLEEVVRLSRLTDNLLALARADAGEGLHQSSRLCLRAACQSVCEKLGPIAEHAGIRLSTEGAEQAEIHGDPVAIERIVVNLVENALRHSERGDAVRVQITDSAQVAAIEVVDEGTGIPPEHLPRIFDRFYRVESARTRDSGGAGLGLAMVKALTELHGGRVAVRSDFGAGATFLAEFPKGPRSRAT
ncbi:MAG: HAMP domain-containing protein [Verrucomicrobiales bacterium]|nr:HAMP domain-containing protein [Verrucomicrobiales bacterium]